MAGSSSSAASTPRTPSSRRSTATSSGDRSVQLTSNPPHGLIQSGRHGQRNDSVRAVPGPTCYSPMNSAAAQGAAHINNSVPASARPPDRWGSGNEQHNIRSGSSQRDNWNLGFQQTEAVLVNRWGQNSMYYPGGSNQGAWIKGLRSIQSTTTYNGLVCEHGENLYPGFECNYCLKERNGGGATWFKHYLVGRPDEVADCTKRPLGMHKFSLGEPQGTRDKKEAINEERLNQLASATPHFDMTHGDDKYEVWQRVLELLEQSRHEAEFQRRAGGCYEHGGGSGTGKGEEGGIEE